MINDAIRELEDAISNTPLKTLNDDIKNAEKQLEFWAIRVRILTNDIEIHTRELQLMNQALFMLQS